MPENLPSPAPRASAERITLTLRTRSNPLQGIDPARLAAMATSYRAGYVRDMADLLDVLFEREGQLLSVAPKRWRAVSSLDWQLSPLPGAPKGRALDLQTAAADHLLRTLTVKRALRQDEKGGLRRLVEFLMEASAYGWSPHELAWIPSRTPQGQPAYRVACTQLPLRYFEATTGVLRYLAQDYDLSGSPLAPNQWLVHAMRPLGVASAIACVLKNLSLQDWLFFSEKYSCPTTIGETPAAQGSPEWKNFEEMVANLGNDSAAIMSQGCKVVFEHIGTAGTNPQTALVEYMDRALAVLWRGGDLSTLSATQGVGANSQQEEKEALEEDDAIGIGETIQQGLVAPLIRSLYGDEPLVTFNLRLRNRSNTAQRLSVLTFARDSGIPLGIPGVREELDLPAPGPEETEFLSVPAPAPSPFGGPLANAGEDTLERKLLAAYDTNSAALLAEVEALPEDPVGFRQGVQRILTRLPELLPSDDPAVLDAWEACLSDALITGVIAAAKPQAS